MHQRRELQQTSSQARQRETNALAQVQREYQRQIRDSVTEQLQRTEREIVKEKEIGE